MIKFVMRDIFNLFEITNIKWRQHFETVSGRHICLLNRNDSLDQIYTNIRGSRIQTYRPSFQLILVALYPPMR